MITEIERIAECSGILEDNRDITYEEFSNDRIYEDEYGIFLNSVQYSLARIDEITEHENIRKLRFDTPYITSLGYLEVHGTRNNEIFRIALEKVEVENELNKAGITSQYLTYDTFRDLYPIKFNNFLINLAIRKYKLDDNIPQDDYKELRSQIASKEILLQVYKEELSKLKHDVYLANLENEKLTQHNKFLMEQIKDYMTRNNQLTLETHRLTYQLNYPRI